MDPILIVIAGMIVVLVSILVFRLHAFLALLLASLFIGGLTSSQTLMEYAVTQGMSETAASHFASQTIGKRIAAAFGNTAGKIGILIALASIIGTCLLKSGAADRIVRSALSFLGERRAALAFLGSGFTLAIPVYFDTVFYLLFPLGRSLAIRYPQNYALYLMTIVAGTAMAHSLIPPTPGPLFVAEELGVDLGLMILMGLAVGICTALAGYVYASWANQKWGVPVRDTHEMKKAEIETLAQKPSTDLPALRQSLFPILLPIVLISGNTILQALWAEEETTRSNIQGYILQTMEILGDSNVALMISAFFALLLLWRREKEVATFQLHIQQSLFSAGMIILITAAGGALGGMLQQTGISLRIEQLAGGYQIALLPFAFLVAALVRTAQGSATVSMITTVGVLSGLASSTDLPFHPVYLAIAVGCGSKLVPWMNDSGFWIITQMSGMKEKETLKHFSVLLSVMGLVGLFVTMVLAQLFPLVNL